MKSSERARRSAAQEMGSDEFSFSRLSSGMGSLSGGVGGGGAAHEEGDHGLVKQQQTKKKKTPEAIPEEGVEPKKAPAAPAAPSKK